eukprot:SAG22_NODE_16442_length_325_cov_0.787611_1_plen_24_part_10
MALPLFSAMAAAFFPAVLRTCGRS